MIRERPIVLRRTCGDRHCWVCGSLHHDICAGGWRCREWLGRVLELDASGDVLRLPECLAAEKEG